MTTTSPHRRHRPPLLERVSTTAARFDRRPGAHARHLSRMRRWSGAKWTAGAVQVAGLGALALLFGLFGGSVVAVCLGLTLFGGAWLMWDKGAKGSFHRAKLAMIGSQAEAGVAGALDVSGLRVRHSVMLGAGGDADHVVVSTDGRLAVVETKAGGGTVKVAADGRVLKGSGPIHGDPIGQVLRQAAALSQRAGGATADAVVCVASMSNRPFFERGVWFCSKRDLPAVLRRLPARVTPATADRICASLRR